MTDVAVPAWVQDKYFIKQRFLAINERYAIQDEAGNDVLFVRRPARLLRNLLAVFALIGGLLITVAVTAGVIVATGVSGGVGVGIGAVLGVGGFIASLALMLWIIPYRHVGICTDPDYRDTVLSVSQDNKAHPLIQRFSLHIGAADGPVLARFRKNVLWNMLRRRWQILSPEGELVALAMEDSILMSLLRRTIGQYLPWFRTNFIIVRADDRSLLGTFNRKFSIRDNYSFDLNYDSDRCLDRRVALAIGVLLDSGERR